MTCFSIPTQMPPKNQLIREMLEAVFPDRPQTATDHTYYSLCDTARKEYGFHPTQPLVIGSSGCCMLYELNQIYLNEFKEKLSDSYDVMSFWGTYNNFSTSNASGDNMLNRFCDPNRRTLVNWLSSPDGGINIYYATAVFFSVLLLNRPACAATGSREAFLKKCLAYLGITEIPVTFWEKLTAFDWNERSTEETVPFMDIPNGVEPHSFHRLTNRPSILLGTALMTVLKLLGTDPSSEQATIEQFQKLFKEMFKEELMAEKALQAAEEKLWNCLRYFEPRTVTTSNQNLNPQDFFVIPSFRKTDTLFRFTDNEEVNPSQLIYSAKTSRRCMIMGNTGQGKSMYLQLMVFSLLYDKYNDTPNEKVNRIKERLGIAKDKYVISVPARMFSTCFHLNTYKPWTDNFIDLYFNCMWKFPEKNFFSLSDTLGKENGQEGFVAGNYQVTDILKDYLKTLARQGQLVLVLDSYDEIALGQMRSAYNKALSHFYDNYCSFFEQNESGAHILLSSRCLSADTMHTLFACLNLNPSCDLFRICELNNDNIRELVENWNRYYRRGETGLQTQQLLEELENNHFCREYACNPYMLSVMCGNFDKGFDTLTKTYIDALSKLVKMKTSKEPQPVQDVLNYMRSILEEIAGVTVLEHQPHITRELLDQYLSKYLNNDELTQEQKNGYMERLHEIFVTVIGLIVPADGSDRDYQFINQLIRYELAANGFQKAIAKTDQLMAYRDVILPDMENVEEYVGYLVPLICCITRDYALAEQLVIDLVTHKARTPEEEALLVTAMLDLLKGRYSPNIATIKNPGKGISEPVRRAQWLLMMRIQASPRKLSKREYDDFCNSHACKANQKNNWLRIAICPPDDSTPT